jgi:hypothetical protein
VGTGILMMGEVREVGGDDLDIHMTHVSLFIGMNNAKQRPKLSAEPRIVRTSGALSYPLAGAQRSALQHWSRASILIHEILDSKVSRSRALDSELPSLLTRRRTVIDILALTTELLHRRLHSAGPIKTVQRYL